MPKYSIIVPVYNAEIYLPEAIESVLNQDYEDWELILINDGSTDNSEKICRYYQKQDERIKIVSKNNEGVSNARNTGIEKAEGEFIVFLDADDWISKDYLKISNRILYETSAELLILNYNEVKGSCITKGTAINEILCTGVYSNKDDLIKFTLELASGDSRKWYGLMRPVWAKVFKKCLIQEHKVKFDPKLKYGEDAAFLLTYITLVEKIAYRNEYLYYYRNNVASAMNNKKWEGSSHGEHYFSVVEKTIKNYASENSLAKFWFNIAENDWKVLEKENISYRRKRNIIKELLSAKLYIRFTKKTVASNLNKKQRIEAFLIRNKLCDGLLLMYYMIKKRQKKERVYVHFFSKQNYGDDVFVCMLTNRYPNNYFIISGTDANLSAFRNKENVVIHKDNKFVLKINRAIKKIAKIDLLYYIRAYKCKICLTIGGSIFIEPQKEYLNTYLRDKKCRFYHGKKNIILGANFGPYRNSKFVEFFRKDFQRYDLVTFRDKESYDKFKTVPSVKYAPDILFGLEAFYKENRKLENVKDYIVISVIDIASDRSLYIDKIIEMIRYYEAKEFRCVLLSLCHEQGDYELCNDINRKARKQTEILDYDGNAQTVMQYIKNAKYVIASRFHAIVTSFVFGVPCFPVIYSNKTSNMLNDIGFNGRTCQIDNLANESLEDIDFNRVNTYVVDIKKTKVQSKGHFEELDKYL